MATIDPDAALPAAVRNPRHVLVIYESSPDGQAALSHALGIAYAAGAVVSVVAVVPYESVKAGCARCRGNAAMWNHELGEIAQDELAEAARWIGRSSSVEYDVARGPQVKAISDAAARSGADLIVLPWRRSSRVRARFSRELTERLSRDGHWRVVVAPSARESAQRDSIAANSTT
jgi:nucleotide-binding universal stress UspA family protein